MNLLLRVGEVSKSWLFESSRVTPHFTTREGRFTTEGLPYRVGAYLFSGV